MFVKKFFIEMYPCGGLVLKSLLQGTRWCNRISIKTLGLGTTTFFLLQKAWDMLTAAFLSLLHGCSLIRCMMRGTVSEGPRNQLNSAQLREARAGANYFPWGSAAGMCHPGRCLGAP